MSIETGETVTIKRGKLAGRTGEVKNGPDSLDQYAVHLDTGELIVQKGSNLRAPEEMTVTVRQLDQAIELARQETSLDQGFSARDLVEALEQYVPGIGAKLGL